MSGAGSLGRKHAITGLVGIGFLNAISFSVEKAITEYGLVGAVTNTFGISAIVWAAAYVALSQFWSEPDRALGHAEETQLFGLALFFLVPVKYVSWIGLTLLALHIVSNAAKGSAASKGGWILLAITFPMFWSKLIFSVFSKFLLQADATLVSLLLGLPRLGNVITLADGETHLWIAAGCSSLANVSLALLGWTLFLHMPRSHAAPGLLWGILSCGLIIALNVGRISLIGLFPAHYALIHGPVGASVASWLMVASVFGLLSYGARRAA